ncbi:hypothetical protein V8C42DRAFT_321458 [Trichoderma barbatum]
MTAVLMNGDIRDLNEATYSRLQTTDFELAPLVDLRTGEYIEGFPATIRAIDQLTELETWRICDALGYKPDGMPLVSLRGAIRHAAARL